MKRLNSNRLGNRLPRIRILRSWRGYAVGAVIQPPAGAREVLLASKDQLGNKIAELVVDAVAPVFPEEPEILESPAEEPEEEYKPKTPRKGKSK